MRLKADLHIHSCLSPCADLRMVPPDVMKRAAEMDLNMIAICDHNSCENAASFIEAGKEERIVVFPGIEVCTREEAHILGLFGDLKGAMKLQELIYENLEGTNDEDAFGIQAVVDQKGDPVGINEHLLIGATALPVESVVDAIHAFGGVAIASHVDRESFGIVGQLGFIPERLALDALELSRHVPEAETRYWKEEYRGYPLVRSSDAHCPEEIGAGTTTFLMDDATFGEFRKALAGEDGRGIAGWPA